jgi:hypothetical protein
MLTENEKKVLRTGGKSMYKVRFKARKKTREALEDLKFLSEVYPEVVVDNFPVLLDMLRQVLRIGKVTREESVVYMKNKCYIQLAGILKEQQRPDKPTARRRLLRKPELFEKLSFCYELLKIMHQELQFILGEIKPWEVLSMNYKEKEVSWRPTFARWLEKGDFEDEIVLIRRLNNNGEGETQALNEDKPGLSAGLKRRA